MPTIGNKKFVFLFLYYILYLNFIARIKFVFFIEFNIILISSEIFFFYILNIIFHKQYIVVFYKKFLFLVDIIFIRFVMLEYVNYK